MKKILFILGIFILPIALEAQIGVAFKKLKNKIDTRINNKVDSEVEKSLDGIEGKNKISNDTAKKNLPEASASAMVKSYSKYDFVAGDKVLYAEDFAKDNIGELPLNWNASGKGELVKIENATGNWLRLYPDNKYTAGNRKSFGENYTIEFDVIINGTPPSGTRYFPSFTFGFFGGNSPLHTPNDLLYHYRDSNMVEIFINPNVDDGSKLELKGRSRGVDFFTSGTMKNAAFSATFSHAAHYAIQVQKQRLRFWVNENKIFDIPKAIGSSAVMNNLFFNINHYWPYNEDNFAMYVSNFKVASGVADTRHKLLEDGVFSTTGILFAHQSAEIKEESAGVIREIAGVLTENPEVKIRITGHTSADGDDAANLELSRKRSAAVKDVLVKTYSISAERIQADGKGESQPVADNKTPEGRAQNRRVEFVKL